MLPFRVLTQLLSRPSPYTDRSISTPPSRCLSAEIVTHALSPNGAKRSPFFPIACTLFSIQNIVHPICFVDAAHSLAKTPGGRGSHLSSSQAFRFPPNPTESCSFTAVNANRETLAANQHPPSARRPKTTKAILSGMRTFYFRFWLILAAALSSALLSAPSHAQDAKYQTDLTAWRARHASDLQKPAGWLSLTGLDWLEAGDNTFGSAADNKIKLIGCPAHLG